MVGEPITLVRQISTCLHLHPGGQFQIGTRFEISRFAQGRAGILYRCTSTSGKPTPTLVVKLLRQSKTLANVRSLVALHQAIARQADRLPHGWQARLRGLPFWIGEAEFQGERRIALFCLDLTALGFERFDHLLEPAQWKDYHKLDFTKRVALATSFVRGYALLEDLRFLHADINSENLVVNLQTLEAVLIDYDSGVLRLKGDEEPQTPGKPNEFVAPELKSQHGVDLPNEYAERWAVGFLIHTLMFAIHPLYFLSELSVNAIQEYRKDHTWPKIGRLALTQSIHSQSVYWHFRLTELHQLQKLRPDAFTLLHRFINEGALDPHKRPSVKDWDIALAEKKLWSLPLWPKLQGRAQKAGGNAPGERLIYTSDFSGKPVDWNEGILKDGKARAFCKEGFYHIALLPPTNSHYFHWCHPGGETPTNFRVSVEAGIIPVFAASGQAAFYGIVFRLHQGNYYYFSVSPDGRFWLTCFRDGKDHPLLAKTHSRHINKLATLNLLTVSMRGRDITLGANGKTLATTRDPSPPLEPGYTGLFVGTFSADTPAEARFRNFRLYDLT